MNAIQKPKLLLPLVALLIGAMMMVAACGDDGDDGDSGSGAAAPTTDTSTASTTTTTTTTDTSTGTTSEPTTTTTEPAMMEPVVDRVVTAFEAPSTEGNETRHIGQTTVWQMKPMYEYLIDSHPITDEMLPGLALEWAVEEGAEGPQVRFKLREGVQFHDDWGEFTAADVVHTMWNHQREGGLHGELVYFQDVTYETTAINDYEVLF
ncbi:MAG: ABC transporter substrate-binding protein, partial [Chloroflexota bacterium]|nr:ABC transporter substrate-binding protein [Chloroflexota bacterium]